MITLAIVIFIIVMCGVIILIQALEINSKNQNNALLQNKITALNNQITTLTEKNKAQTNLIKLLETKNTLLKEEITWLSDDITYLKNIIESLEAENEELREWAVTYNSDLDLLSRLLMAEAGGSTLEDIQCVGVVAMNRVVHKDFPDTLREVVYQPGQYAPTWNGAINKTPSERCVEVARELLNGERYGVPENVVFQSQEQLGSGLWKQVGVHYYCYR